MADIVGTDLVDGSSSARGYPPVFYLATGWVTQVADERVALYGMRVASGALVSALLAVSLALLFGHQTRWRPHVAVLLAVTPAVFFLSGTMNPTGLATASVILLAVLTYRWTQSERGMWSWQWPVAMLVVGLIASGIRPLTGLFCGLAVCLVTLAAIPRTRWPEAIAFGGGLGLVLAGTVAARLSGRFPVAVGRGTPDRSPT